MKKLLFQLFFFPVFVFSQSFTINPYLQNVTPNNITIMWEFSNWDVSFVEWGSTDTLGNIDSTTFEFTSFPSCLFKARLTGLEEGKKYYYRVITGDSVSSIFDFYTPSNHVHEKPVNMVVMSDMQTDGNNPKKFTEIINNGIINYLHNNYLGNVNENLDMILIPGDLVSTGTNYLLNQNHYFLLYLFILC